MANYDFRLPCGHWGAYKCGGSAVWTCATCGRYFSGQQRYPEELPRMTEVQPIGIGDGRRYEPMQATA